MRTGSAWIVWFLCIFALICIGAVKDGHDPTAVSPAYRAQVKEIAEDQSSVRAVQTAGHDRPIRSLRVPNKDDAGRELRARLKSSVKPGDLVVITEAAATTASPTLAKLDVQSLPVPAWQRGLTLVVAALLLLSFAKAALDGGLGRLVVGLDGRTSNSKFQLVVWFGVVMVTYLASLWLRFCYSSNLLVGGITIPTNLLSISGLSALSFAGAKAITQGKQNALAEAGMMRALKQPATRPARLSDLVLDDAGNPDLGDFQMLLITLVAAITYLIQIFIFLSSVELRGTVTIPDADSTLLAAFGLGQGAYLAKKYASGPKPPDTPPAGARFIGVPPPGGAGRHAGVVGEADGSVEDVPAAPPANAGGQVGVEA
jgi:hypothetical protein